jgi:hypothetical protein
MDVTVCMKNMRNSAVVSCTAGLPGSTNDFAACQLSTQAVDQSYPNLGTGWCRLRPGDSARPFGSTRPPRKMTASAI